MRVNVIDPNERFAQRPRQRFGRRNPNEQRTDQPWPVCDAHGLNLVECSIGLLQRFAEDGEDIFDVGAAGDFWDDAAVDGVEMGLRGNDVAEDRAAVLDDGGGGFVAGGFDAEDAGHGSILEAGDQREKIRSTSPLAAYKTRS